MAEKESSTFKHRPRRVALLATIGLSSLIGGKIADAKVDASRDNFINSFVHGVKGTPYGTPELTEAQATINQASAQFCEDGSSSCKTAEELTAQEIRDLLTIVQGNNRLESALQLQRDALQLKKQAEMAAREDVTLAAKEAGVTMLTGTGLVLELGAMYSLFRFGIRKQSERRKAQKASIEES